MEPVSHALLGAMAAQALFSRQLGRWAAAIGAVGGVVADIDRLLRIPGDPFLTLVLHRHFTHSLLMIPLGGLLAMLPFLLVKKLQYRRRVVYGAATLGFATHAPLDALTSYGTSILWPVWDERVALDGIANVDPLFTLILLVGVALSLRKGLAKPARVLLLVAGLYLALGLAQHQRALDVQRRLIASRYDQPDRGRAMPTLGNIVVWRSVYETHGRLFVDTIRVPLFGEATVKAGESQIAFRREHLLRQAPQESPLVRDFDLFAMVADGYVARVPQQPGLLGDVRYSHATGSVRPLWSFQYDPEDPAQPARLAVEVIDRRQALRELWAEVWHGPPDAVAVSQLGKQ